MKIQTGAAIVTGASSGLGKAFSEALLGAGWTVHGTSRDLARLPARERFIPWELDLADPGSRERFLKGIFERVGAPDLYLGNAGSGIFGRYSDMGRDREAELWEILLHGPLHLLREMFDAMGREGKGTLLSISSLAAELPIPYCAVYNGAKAALSQTVQSLMLESPGAPWIKDIRLGDFRTSFNQAMSRVPPPEGEKEATQRWETAWQAVERNLESSPSTEILKPKILNLAQRPGHETLRWGGFFQSKVAPFAASCLPSPLRRYLIAKYYGLSI